LERESETKWPKEKDADADSTSKYVEPQSELEESGTTEITSGDVTGRLNKIGQTISEYKDKIATAFKDMDVEVRDWHFAVGKAEKEYAVEVNIKLIIKPKEVR